MILLVVLAKSMNPTRLSAKSGKKIQTGLDKKLLYILITSILYIIIESYSNITPTSYIWLLGQNKDDFCEDMNVKGKIQPSPILNYAAATVHTSQPTNHISYFTSKQKPSKVIDIHRRS